MPLAIIRQDITTMHVDVIVNAANTQLRKGGGVCGAIFNAAGAENLQTACDVYAPIKVGGAVLTSGFKLPARYIIHTVGPVYKDGKSNEEKLLSNAYWNSLELAIKHECTSIAFPLISSGIYGYPKDEALHVAMSTIRSFLESHELMVYLVLFDKASFKISQERLGDIQSYIDENYVETHTFGRGRFNEPDLVQYKQASVKDIQDWVKLVDQSFSETLLYWIDVKGMKDVEVYKRANMDRKLFSKIRSNKDYIPNKRNVLALCIAMRLDIKETEALLECAGYALSSSQLFDVIIRYYIENKIYDIDEINTVLFQYDLALLGV
ncbi:MAG TPA: RNase III inhibitor [Erysipelotrichaceae bacterium]|nr:RNase III inhibitor [Erysipelotrichaceae bacterium]